jgi:uncharacterized protein YaeQ
MAEAPTLRRFRVSLSDVDRGVYEALDLRVSQHPSETWTSVIVRVLARCLHHGPGLEFSPGGVSSTEEPAIVQRDPTGALLTWIEVGVPSVERLHRATQRADEVWIYPTRDWKRAGHEWTKGRIHAREKITVVTLPAEQLEALARVESRVQDWELTRNDGSLYVQREGETLTVVPMVQSLATKTES